MILCETISPKDFQTTMRTVLASMTGGSTFAKTAMEVNQGLCAEFGREVVEAFGFKSYDHRANPHMTSTKWYWDDSRNLDLEKMRDLGEPVPIDLLKTKEYQVRRELGSIHYWLVFNDRHYDAECLDGTDHFLNLPFFQRIIAELRK